MVNEHPTIPIDWLISDVLSMKVEAWKIQNKEIFDYCDYLEKCLFRIKKGELILETGDIKTPCKE